MKNLSRIVLLSILAVCVLIAVGSAFQEGETSEPYSDSIIYADTSIERSQNNNDNSVQEDIPSTDDNNISISDISSDIQLGNSSVSSYADNKTQKEAKIIKYTSRDLNMMSEADSLASILGVIPKGTSVILYEDCDCDWICVEYKHHYGYVRSIYLANKIYKTNPTTAPGLEGSTDHTNIVSSNGIENTDRNEKEIDNNAPEGATALCNDGTYSFSVHRQGTCSWHGGVKKWLK